MERCIAFDLTQLFSGIEKPTPRGIDRVDLAYARHFLERWPGDCVATLPTPWGIRWFDRARSLRAVNYIEEHWGEAEHDGDQDAYDRIKQRILGEPSPAPPRTSRSTAARVVRNYSNFTRRQGLALGRPIRSLPPRAIYLNTGQVALGFGPYFRWLSERSDVEAVFMLHDVIPVEFPEYCRPTATRMHRQALDTTARHARRVIATTEAAGASIRRELRHFQRADIDMLCMPLPVPAPFLQPTAPDRDLAGVPYFVICGTIEPRKNHLMLLNVWRELAKADGAECPKLVVVGARSKAGASIVDLLERCPVLKGHVIEVSGLPTPALRQLMAGARALLMPSFAEGYGLPIVEALAVGTPVIASNLASHQEAGGCHALYLDPIDGLGWMAAVRGHMAGGAVRAQPSAVRPAVVRTYAEYFARVEPFVAGQG